MVEFLSLPEERRRLYIQQVNNETGMSLKAIEKDWWVTLVLKAIFALPMSEHFVFKGGTSLSKGWKLIERMSEDVDIALAPEAFNKKYKTEPSVSYVKQLKRDGTAYSSTVISVQLLSQLQAMGVPENLFSISVELVLPSMRDKDPQTVFVHYMSLYEADDYLTDYIKVEFGVRSLKEPFDDVTILSAIGAYIKTSSYTEHPFPVKAVVPEKTMIEKLLLLHERFSRGGADNIVIAERQSRHLIDIVRLKQQNVHLRVLSNPALFQAIVKHRSHYVRLRGVNYEQMALQALQIVPPLGFVDQFREDYKTMLVQMIYGEAVDFDTIISELEHLAGLFRALEERGGSLG